MTVSAIEFSRLGPPKLHLFAMKCDKCGELSPWWERSHCYKCGGDSLSEFELKGTGARCEQPQQQVGDRALAAACDAHQGNA